MQNHAKYANTIDDIEFGKGEITVSFQTPIEVPGLPGTPSNLQIRTAADYVRRRLPQLKLSKDQIPSVGWSHQPMPVLISPILYGLYVPGQDEPFYENQHVQNMVRNDRNELQSTLAWML